VTGVSRASGKTQTICYAPSLQWLPYSLVLAAQQ